MSNIDNNVAKQGHRPGAEIQTIPGHYNGMTAAEWAYIADNQGAALLAITEALGCDDHEVIQTIEALKAAASGSSLLIDTARERSMKLAYENYALIEMAAEALKVSPQSIRETATSRAAEMRKRYSRTNGAQEAAAFMSGDRWMSPVEVDAIRCDWPSVLDERGAEAE